MAQRSMESWILRAHTEPFILGITHCMMTGPGINRWGNICLYKKMRRWRIFLNKIKTYNLFVANQAAQHFHY